MKRRILAAILAGGMLFTVTACGEQEVEAPQTVLVQEEEEEAYPVTTVEYGDVVKNVTLRCNYESTNKQELAFSMDGGLVERVEVKMGDYVNAGDLLVSLDVQDLEAQIEEMEYQVDSQELRLKQKQEMKEFDLESAEIMFGYTHMTKQDEENLKEKKESIEAQYKTTLEDMSDQLALLKQRLQQCQEELDAGQLFADITGEITYLQNSLEDTYTKKDRVVVTVSDLNACYFIAGDMEYAEYFQEGVSVTVNYREGAENLSCEVVPALMDSWETNGKMYFKPVESDMMSIASETNGNLPLELARRENVLCVPVDAVHESDNGPFVYLENNGLLEMRYVTVGLEGDELIEITDGLEQGEIVALKN